MFFKKKQRFSIRKFTIGACSVLLGTVFVSGVDQVAADDVTPATEVTAPSTEQKGDEAPEAEQSQPTTVVAEVPAVGAPEAELIQPSAVEAEKEVAPAVEAPVVTPETAPADRHFVVKNKLTVLDASNLSDSEKAAVQAMVRSDNSLTESFKVFVANDGSVTILENSVEVARLASAEVVEAHTAEVAPVEAAEAPTTVAATEPAAPGLTVSAENAPKLVADGVDLEALKAKKVAELNTYTHLSAAVRAQYLARFQEAVDAAALELVAKEAKRAQLRAQTFPTEGKVRKAGTYFRADVAPTAEEVLDTEGWEKLGRFSNKPGIFYVQQSGTINGGNSTDKKTLIYEVDTKTGKIVQVSQDTFAEGGTLYGHLEKLSGEQGFNTPGQYRVVNALGLSNDGRYAYALGITSDIRVTDRTTINAIYRYDMQTKTWSVASNSDDWADGMAVMTTNAWTAGAVNPKDGKYYFGTLTLKADPAFSRVAPGTQAAYETARDNNTFDLYFRMWSFDPATGTVANAGYIDTNLVKSGKFDKNESYFKATGESYVVGNDIAFDTDGNMKLILNQFNTSNYYVYSVDQANFDAAVAQNNKYPWC